VGAGDGVEMDSWGAGDDAGVLGGIDVERLVNDDGEVGAGDSITRIYKYCGFSVINIH
jgi:hypothetical protein